MESNEETDLADILAKELQARPDEAYVFPDGTALAMWGEIDKNVWIIVAPLGKNFKTMSDEEINNHIVETLTELHKK